MRPFILGLSSWFIMCDDSRGTPPPPLRQRLRSGDLPLGRDGAGPSRRGLGAAVIEVEHGADVLQAEREADLGIAQPRAGDRPELAELEAQAVALLRPVDRIVLLPQEVVLHVIADLRLDRELLRDDVQSGVDAD